MASARFSDAPSEMRLFDPRNQPGLFSESLGVPIKQNNGGKNQSQWRRAKNDPLYLKTSGLFKISKERANVNLPLANTLRSEKIRGEIEKVYPYVYDELVDEYSSETNEPPTPALVKEIQQRAWQSAYEYVLQLRKNKRIDPELYKSNMDYFFSEEDIPFLRAAQENLYVTPENARRIGEIVERNVRSNAVNLSTLKTPPATSPNLVNWKARGLNLENNENNNLEDENSLLARHTPAELSAMVKGFRGGRGKKKRVQTFKKNLRRRGRGTQKARRS